jgi:hypothetical protein
MTITTDALRADVCEGEGRSEVEESRSYTVTVRLVSDAEGADTVSEARAYLKANGNMPWYGRRWGFGTAKDPLATCRSVKITRLHNVFDVYATYTTDTEKKEEKPDNNGDPSDDPLKWRTQLDLSYSQTAMAIEKAKFLGYSIPAGNPWLQPGRIGPIVNSALQPLDVQHLKEVDIQIIRCTFNRREWDQAEAEKFIGKVNQNNVLVLMPAIGFRANFPKQTLKVRQYGGRNEFQNRKSYWAITLEVMYKPDTWVLEVLDSGFGIRNAPGDKKVDNSTHPADAETWSVGELARIGNTPVTHAQDDNGFPMAVPANLDGNGQILPAGQDPVYLRYQIYPEVSFATLFALASQ